MFNRPEPMYYEKGLEHQFKIIGRILFVLPTEPLRTTPNLKFLFSVTTLCGSTRTFTNIDLIQG